MKYSDEINDCTSVFLVKIGYKSRSQPLLVSANYLNTDIWATLSMSPPGILHTFQNSLSIMSPEAEEVNSFA